MAARKPNLRKIKDAALIDAYKETFRGDAGNLVLNDLSVKFHVLSSTTVDGLDLMAHNEGERNVVLYILDQLNTTPKDLDNRYEQVKIDSMQWKED